MDTGPLQKRCVECQEVRPLGWFTRRGEGRLRARCRECLRAQRSEGAARRRSRLAVGSERVRSADIERIGERQGWRCRGCGVPIRVGYHVDHVVALARGGRHEVGNLQLLCARCNLAKGSG